MQSSGLREEREYTSSICFLSRCTREEASRSGEEAEDVTSSSDWRLESGLDRREKAPESVSELVMEEEEQSDLVLLTITSS